MRYAFQDSKTLLNFQEDRSIDMRIFMVIIVLTILALGFMNECEAQYLPEVSSYNIYWNKLDAGQTPTVTDVFKTDTVITMLWERGNAATPPYVSSYTGTLANAMVIVNSPTIWTGNIAAVGRDVILENGIYEVTVTESDIYNNESGPSNPMFIAVAKKIARIQINLRLR